MTLRALLQLQAVACCLCGAAASLGRQEVVGYVLAMALLCAIVNRPEFERCPRRGRHIEVINGEAVTERHIGDGVWAAQQGGSWYLWTWETMQWRKVQ